MGNGNSVFTTMFSSNDTEQRIGRGGSGGGPLSQGRAPGTAGHGDEYQKTMHLPPETEKLARNETDKEKLSLMEMEKDNAEDSVGEEKLPPEKDERWRDLMMEEPDRMRPLPKLKEGQQCYARDEYGVIYAAVVRRLLYGPEYHRVACLLTLTGGKTAGKPEPGWHYFVHYKQWGVSFDRWVPEEWVFEDNEEMKALSERLLEEHKLLQQKMTKKAGSNKRKKGWQTIDGAAFLHEWKLLKEQVEQDMKYRNDPEPMNLDDGDGDDSNKKPAGALPEKAQKEPMITKSILESERMLRKQSLRSKPPQEILYLPFALNKVLTEEWEVVTVCGMAPCLPAPFTVRDVLNLYLESKNIAAAHQRKLTIAADTTVSGKKFAIGRNTKVSGLLGRTPASIAPSKVAAKHGQKDAEIMAREQGWRDMADGIAMLFDEALESRLLYAGETYILNDGAGCDPGKPCSEMYGCEYLLRLLVILPEMLADQLDDQAEKQMILAKIMDLVRFLNKNSGTVFTQTYRKSDATIKVQQKLLKAKKLDSKRRKQ